MRPLFAATVAALIAASPAPAIANPVQDADLALLRAVNRAHTPAGDVAMSWLSNEPALLLVPVAAGLSVGGAQPRWAVPLSIVESELVAGVLMTGAKWAVGRPRPYETYADIRVARHAEPMASFPSGHAAVSFAGATTLALAEPAWAAPAFTWAGLVCVSRLYNGVHYPSDVLAGAALGVGSAYLARWIFGGLNAQLGAPGPAVAMPMFQTAF